MSVQNTQKPNQQMTGRNRRERFADYSDKGTPGFKQTMYRGSTFSTTAERSIDSETLKIPTYNNYQLLGDSQFVRFSQQMLGYSVDYTTRLRRIGYCVSGQKIEELRCRLSDNELPIHSQVIVLIGTNDFVYGSSYTQMCQSYQRMVTFLRTKCTRIVLLTVPPVPRIEQDQRHWTKLENFNRFIMANNDDKQVITVDLCKVLAKDNYTACREYFERVYNSGPRVDLIHLNRRGFGVLQVLLDMELTRFRPSGLVY